MKISHRLACITISFATALVIGVLLSGFLPLALAGATVAVLLSRTWQLARVRATSPLPGMIALAMMRPDGIWPGDRTHTPPSVAVVVAALVLGSFGAGNLSAADAELPDTVTDLTDAQDGRGEPRVDSEPLAAGDLAAQLSCAGLPTGMRIVHSAGSDPNGLLGEPDGYDSRSDLVDTRVADTLDGISSGIVVEGFADASDAQARSDYIARVIEQANLPSLREFGFVIDRFLLRVTGQLDGDQAQEYADALADLPANGPIEPCEPTHAAPAELHDIPQARSELAISGDLGTLGVSDGKLGLVSTLVVGSSIAFVLHNGTDQQVSRVEVSGRVRDGSGATLGTGSSQGIQPNVIETDGYAIGIVYVGEELPNDAVLSEPAIDFTRGLGAFENIVSLVVSQPEQIGDGNVIGDASNPYDVDVKGPISVTAVCLNENGQLSAHLAGYADRGAVGVEQSTTFTLRAHNKPVQCSTLLVAASGYIDR